MKKALYVMGAFIIGVVFVDAYEKHPESPV